MSNERNVTVAGIVSALTGQWPVVAGMTALGVAVAIVVSLLMKPVYRADALIVPVQEMEGAGAGSILGRLGGVASLAGINLPNGRDEKEALATLRSRKLATKLIEEKKLMPILFSERWDRENNRWREQTNGKQPTLGDAIDLFDRRVRRIREDSKTGLVTVSVEWHDRQMAADWANQLVTQTNELMRERAINEAEKLIEYLQREAEAMPAVQVREAIYSVIEGQVKSKAMAVVRHDFAFRVIDPAIPADPDKKIMPRPALFIVLGGFTGFLLGSLLGLYRQKLS